MTPLDLHLVALEETGLWELDIPGWRAAVQRIETVYLFDRNERTHSCELTPSYWLLPVETRAIFHDPDQDSRLTDRIDGEISRCPPEPCYVHCHTLDDLIERLKTERFRYYHLGDPELPFEAATEEESRNAILEAMSQACRENAVL